MDAKLFIKEKSRMCKSVGGCSGCLSVRKDGGTICVFNEDLVDIVEKWSMENPPETYRSHFLKLFPNANICKGKGAFGICRADVYRNRPTCDAGCTNCWDEIK